MSALQTRYCKSCGAPILWLQHETTKRIAPIDADPDRAGRGNIQVDLERERYALVLVSGGAIPGLHTSHFLTCPQQEKWRSRKPA